MDFISRLFQGKQLVRSREILTFFQAPRFTTSERDALISPQDGQIIFNTTTLKHQGYDGTTWNNFY